MLLPIASARGFFIAAINLGWYMSGVYVVRWTDKQRDAFRRRWLRFRENYGVSQVVIAELLEISVATVNRIERGKFVPRDETVEKFSALEKMYREGDDIKRSLAWVPGEASEI